MAGLATKALGSDTWENKRMSSTVHALQSTFDALHGCQ